MKSEPVRVASILTAVVSALIALAVAFGADLSDEERNAILAATAAFAPLIVLLGEAIRQVVVSPQSAADAVVRAKQDTAQGVGVPAINVVGGAYADAVKDRGFTATPPAVNP